MATLKRNQMKYFSEDNMRKIISLTISLANKVDATAEKCINPFTPNTAYTKGSFVTYNNYIYEAKYACNDPDFVEAHWVKLSDEINEIDLDTVKSWLNLSQEELDNLQKLLKDDQITTTSTFSSSKIFSDIQAAIDTAKEYTNNQLGKAVKPAYKVVASTSEVTETGYFYLISNGTNFDMYVLSADGSVVSLGTSDVDLTDYVKTSDLEADYLKKTDADGKFATITTLTTHTDNTDIHVTTTDKTKWDKVEGKVDKTMVKVNGDVLEYIKNNSRKNLTIYWGLDDTNTPYSDGFTGSGEGVLISNVCDERWGSVIGTCGGDYFCINRLMNGTWQGWEKLCTASVVDVPKTLIISENTNVELNSSCTYTVINGICYVTLWGFKATATGQFIVNNSMPKTKAISQGMCSYGQSGGIGACAFIYDDGSDKSKLYIEVNMANETLYGSFSYPVA